MYWIIRLLCKILSLTKLNKKIYFVFPSVKQNKAFLINGNILISICFTFHLRISGLLFKAKCFITTWVVLFKTVKWYLNFVISLRKDSIVFRIFDWWFLPKSEKNIVLQQSVQHEEKSKWVFFDLKIGF